MIDESDRAVRFPGYGTHRQAIEPVARENPKSGIYDSAPAVFCSHILRHSWSP